MYICMQVLTPADDSHHINKHNFKVPFVCGCRDLGEALRRIAEGAAMIRTKVPPCLAPWQPGSYGVYCFTISLPCPPVLYAARLMPLQPE